MEGAQERAANGLTPPVVIARLKGAKGATVSPSTQRLERWRWSKDVKPVAETDLCMAPHQQYPISGRIHVVMADGTELDAGPVRTRRCART